MSDLDKLGMIQSTDGIAADVRSMILQTREGVARTLNAGMTLLYWRIGKRIQIEILGNQRAEYGKEIVQSLSAHMMREFGRGFGKYSVSPSPREKSTGHRRKNRVQRAPWKAPLITALPLGGSNCRHA